jgi:FKBP-type peptidyl-prolyl cis-trans isomerase
MKTAATSVAAVVAASATQSVAPANAAPVIYKLDTGIKYAVTKDSDKSYPRPGDIVAVEYTGYLSNGVIFDATHSEGKSSALLFKLGSTAVIPGINQMVAEMKVGQKVQAIIPPELAFGDKGICLEDGECLVKPGSTLVYDILLKKSSIPPP